MHFPSAAGTPIPWEDGGRRYELAAMDIDAELAFQRQMEDAAWSRLPPPSSPHRADAVDSLNRLLAANEYAFGGTLCLRYLSLYAGQAHYLHHLLMLGHQRTRGVAPAPPPRRDLERRLRNEANAPEGSPRGLVDLLDRGVARDFPFLAAAGSPSAATATPAPSTPDSSPSSAAPTGGAPSVT